MIFESLANELLLHLFEYLKTAHLLHAFYGLNSRFDHLIRAYFRTRRHLDLRFVSKRVFETACQKLVPVVVDRLISIRLADDDETPSQIDLFLTRFSLSQQCPSLESISIYCIRSEQTLGKLLLELSHLKPITCLTINTLLLKDELTVAHMFNVIWSLSSLSSCYIRNIKWSPSPSFNFSSVTSSSLERLSFDGTHVNSTQLTRILQSTPRLRSLSVGINNYPVRDEPLFVAASIVTLEIHWLHRSVDTLIKVLKQTPNLSTLKIKIESTALNLNGYRWEKIITDYLPRLKNLYFDMKVSIPNDDSIENEINTMISSFQTFFWIHDHQWFVRCDWSVENRHTFANVYTIPYAFDHFSHYILNQSKSTSDDINSWSYNRVQSLSYNSSFCESTCYSPVRFCNIHHLKLSSPLDDYMWSVIPNPDRLTSLHISLTNDCSESQLRKLLDCTSRLYSLTFNSFADLKIESINSNCKSIRRLQFKKYFSEARCIELARSPLGSQCEVLLINLAYKASILGLVNTMTNLRALTCKCADDNWTQQTVGSTSEKDESIEWLQKCLPSTFLIIRDLHTGCIRLWIDR